MVSFEWRIVVSDFDERREVTVRCEAACDRKVPFPNDWNTAIRCTLLTDKAKQSVKDFKNKTRATEIECAFVGLPKSCPVASTAGVPGSLVSLKTGVGTCTDYLLCASIERDRWYVHKGTMVDGDNDQERPYGPKDLIIKRIGRDAFDTEVWK